MVFSKSQTFAFKLQHVFLSLLKKNLEKSVLNSIFVLVPQTALNNAFRQRFTCWKYFLVFNRWKTWKSVELSFHVSTWHEMWKRNQICNSDILIFLWRSYFRNPLLSYSVFDKKLFWHFQSSILSRKTHVLKKYSMNVSINLFVPDR